jgi:hypothetical protein
VFSAFFTYFAEFIFFNDFRFAPFCALSVAARGKEETDPTSELHRISGEERKIRFINFV